MRFGSARGGRARRCRSRPATAACASNGPVPRPLPYNPRRGNLLARIPAIDDPLPRRWGRYELLAVLGSGGMGRVYEAHLVGPAGFRKPVALKVLLASQRRSGTLLDEARVLSRLHHRNLVEVYDAGEIDGQLFIAMQLVLGETARELLRRHGPLPPGAVLDLGQQVAAGLAHAHGVGSGRAAIVHRDVKPANLLVDADGTVRLADFGIASVHGDPEEQGPGRRGAGTFGYLAPEVLEDEPFDGRADLFALGVVLTRLATGEAPFPSRPASRYLAALERPEQTLALSVARRILEEKMPALGALIDRMLARKPSDRPADADVVRRELAALLRAAPPGPSLADLVQTDAPRLTTAPARIDVTASRARIEPPGEPIVGRSDDIAQVAAYLDEGARLVTITGTGGIGKTRLAREVAARLGRRPAWFCDLSEARSAASVARAVADTIALQLAAGADEAAQIAAVGRALRHEAPLLVLDNFEQVVAHAPATVGAWLAEAPDARFLVTSRERLRLDDERVLPLAPLDPDDSAALFVARARAAAPGYAPGEEERREIARLVVALDGLPLAVELAAARVRTMPVRRIRKLLAEREDILRGTRRGLPARHATLRDTVAWSWDLLEPWERSALAQLSVFAGGFTIDAATAVLDLWPWAEAPWAGFVVESLLEKSLLHARVRSRSEEPRFALFAAVRDFAAERLLEEGAVRAPDGRSETGPEPARAALVQHGTYFARLGPPDLFQRLGRSDGLPLLGRILDEGENLAVAVEAALERGDTAVAVSCCRAIFTAMTHRGPVRGGIALTGRLLRLGGLTETERAEFTTARALMQWSIGQVDSGERALHEALRLARAAGDRRFEGVVLNELSRLEESRARFEEAEQYTDTALALHRAVGNRRAEGITIGNRSNVRFRQGRIPESRALAEEALAIAREVDDLRSAAMCVGNLAGIDLVEGHHQRAAALYEEAIALHERMGAVRPIAILHANLGILRRRVGEHARSREHLEHALRHALRTDALQLQAAALRELAELSVDEGDLAAAALCADQSEVAHQRLQDRMGLGQVAVTRVRIAYHGGDPAEARAALATAREAVASLGLGPGADLYEEVERAAAEIG